MNWFKHDTCATQDAKLKKLIIRHGAVGYAIYFHCLELIAGDVSETNITFELEHDSEIIAENLHIQGSAEKSGIAIVEEIMRTIIGLGLFQETGGRVFCFKLLKRLDLSMTSNPEFRKLIKGAKTENHDGVMIRHDTVMRASKQASKNDNTDLIVSSSPENSKRPQQAARGRAEEAAAATEKSPEGIAPDLWAWALKKARAKPKVQNPIALAKKIASDPDDIAEYERERKQAEAGKTHFLPDPPPCKCGHKLKADIRNGFAKCPECGKGYEWDQVWQQWDEVEKQDTA